MTGGAGFIGGNLVRRLLGTPEITQVRVVDDLSAGRLANLTSLPLVLHVGSVLDPGVLDEAFAGADAVVHLAAVPSVPRSLADPLRTHDVNVTGTVRVLEAARRHGLRHVVVASSSSVYGANPVLPKSEDLRPVPVSPYAVSKLAAECYALAYAGCFGLPVLALRFFNVFGPLQPAGHAYAAVVPAFIDAALRGQPLPIRGDGRQTRDFTYVDTVGAVIVDALRRRVSSDGPVNLAFGERVSLLEVAAELERQLGRPLPRENLPSRPGDVPHSQADARRLQALFPDVQPVDLRSGLTRTIAWHRDRVPAPQPARA